MIKGYSEYIQRKGYRNRPLTEREKQKKQDRLRIRSRVEHVFGVQLQRAGNLVVRTVGKLRAYIKDRSSELGI